MFIKRESWGEGEFKRFGVSIYTLLCVRKIVNKDLQYSTGNSTQYSVITCGGKESEKELIYAYV